MKFDANPKHLNLEALAKARGELTGQADQTAMARLSLAPATVVDWSAAAHLDGAKVRLQLQATSTLELSCQRCMQAMSWPVDIARAYMFVGDEKYAAKLDANLEESADYDVLPLEPKTNLLELIEDEIVMDIPYAPMHEACPLDSAVFSHLVQASADSKASSAAAGTPDATQAESDANPDAKPHPFAALAKLRKQS